MSGQENSMTLLKIVEQNKPGVRVAFGQEGPVLFFDPSVYF